MRVWRSRPTWMKHLTSSEAACESRWQMLGEWPVSLPRGCSTQGAQQRCHTGACFFVRFLLPSSYLSHTCALLALHFVTQRLCSRTSQSSYCSMMTPQTSSTPSRGAMTNETRTTPTARAIPSRPSQTGPPAGAPAASARHSSTLMMTSTAISAGLWTAAANAGAYAWGTMK